MTTIAPSPDHNCEEEATSVCCREPTHDFIYGMCSACNEFSTWECGLCGEEVDF